MYVVAGNSCVRIGAVTPLQLHHPGLEPSPLWAIRGALLDQVKVLNLQIFIAYSMATLAGNVGQGAAR